MNELEKTAMNMLMKMLLGAGILGAGGYALHRNGMMPDSGTFDRAGNKFLAEVNDVKKQHNQRRAAQQHNDRAKMLRSTLGL